MNFSVPVIIQRVRLRLIRKGSAAAYSHLKQIELIRSSLMKSGLPVATTGGKRPQAKVAFGPAISVGYESMSEYCDVQLVSRLDTKTAPQKISAVLPDGYELISTKSIPKFFPSLEQVTNLSDFKVQAPAFSDTRGAWEKFWSTKNFPVVKKKADREEVIDARALVRSWELEGDDLLLQLRFGPGRTLKPERVIQAVCGWSDEKVAVGTPTCELKVTRLQLYFEKENGDLVEP